MPEFFNPLATAANYKVLATAQTTITDQTDVSNLAGNLTIVSGSKSQVYITGATQPFNPNWKISNLVIRPYMIATNIYRGPQSNRYNPDLFDPKEYPNLDNPGDAGINSAYIKDIQWYLVDSANNQTLIDVSSDNRFSHTWTYKAANESDLVLSDKRTLVIKDNILQKDGIASIVVKFSFLDPFAGISIPVTYEISINNLSTGMGTSKATINSLDGNAFYNATDSEQLRFYGEYYSEGIAVDLDERLQSGTSNTKVQWFIRTSGGWTLLDPVTQDDNEWNKPNKLIYEIHRVASKKPDGSIATTEKTKNAKGGTVLIVRPELVMGSETIRMVVTDDQQSDAQSNALEVIYDYSDPTQCYIWSSNGDKLYKGMNTPGTTLKTVVTYKGTLLEDGDAKYDTFDYFWYRIDGSGKVVENMYLDNGALAFISTDDPNYTADNGFPRKLARSVDIKPMHVENKATFTVDLLDKVLANAQLYRTNLLRIMPTEDDINDAKVIAADSGISHYDDEEILNTARDIRAFNIAQEENILDTANKEVK